MEALTRETETEERLEANIWADTMAECDLCCELIKIGEMVSYLHDRRRAVEDRIRQLSERRLIAEAALRRLKG